MLKEYILRIFFRQACDVCKAGGNGLGGCQVNGFCKRDATNNFLSPRYFNLFNLFVSRALPPLPQGWQKTILFHFFVNPSLINIGGNCESKAVKPGQTQSLVFATYKKSISCLVLCCVFKLCPLLVLTNFCFPSLLLLSQPPQAAADAHHHHHQEDDQSND